MDDHSKLYNNIKCRVIKPFTKRMGWMLVLTLLLIAYVILRSEIDWLTRICIAIVGIMFIYAGFLMKKSAVYDVHMAIMAEWRFTPDKQQDVSWKSSINAMEKFLYQDLNQSKRYQLLAVLNTALVVLVFLTGM